MHAIHSESLDSSCSQQQNANTPKTATHLTNWLNYVIGFKATFDVIEQPIFNLFTFNTMKKPHKNRVMDVNRYLNKNIHKFNVELLEIVFGVENMGELLDFKQTSEFLQSIENDVTFRPDVIKKEPVCTEMRFLYFVDLTEIESSSDTDSRVSPISAWPIANVKNVTKPKGRTPRANRSPEASATVICRPKKTKKLTEKLSEVTITSKVKSQKTA